MKIYSQEFLIKAHKNSSSHKEKILAREYCGCFYCKRVYNSKKIEEWIDEPDGGKTAVCPKCGIDSVLSSELPIDKREFLAAMHNYWFS